MSRLRSLAAVMLAVPSLAAPAIAEQPAAAGSDDGYTYSAPTRFGSGKAFMGRPIADVVSIESAAWFDRSERAQEEGTDKLLPLLGLKPTDVVADIGAGTGYFSFRLAGLVPQGRVIAEDIQQGMLDRIARRKAAGEAANVELVLGSATDPKLPANSVDLVLMVDVWHELAYPREMGTAILRALKPGGRIALVEYRGEDPEASVGNLHKMTESQARRELTTLGFEWVSTDSTTLPLHHLIIFARPQSLL